MINCKADLKEYLACEKGKYKLHRLGLLYYLAGNEEAVIWSWQKCLRYTEYYINCNKKILAAICKVRLNRMSNKYGMHIAPNVCGKGLHVMHLGPILTNGSTRIGENSAVHINTAFVANGTDNAAPVLGNGVVVGVGAVVMGGIRIADNVAIGANAVVCRSVEEENIAVAGVPAKKVSNSGRLEWNKK